MSRNLRTRLVFVVAAILLQLVGSRVPAFDSSHLIQYEPIPEDNAGPYKFGVKPKSQSALDGIPSLTSPVDVLAREKLPDHLAEPPILIPSVGMRWDALHYHEIALRGTYIYEHQYAFSPGVPVVLRVVHLAKQTFLLLIQRLDGATGSLPWVKILADWGFFIAKAALLGLLTCEPGLQLYRLTKRVTRSEEFSLLAMMVHFLMGAPPVILRSAYAEPFFAWCSFKGMRACHDRNHLAAALYFALATSFRTNGIILAGFILYNLVARPILVQAVSALSNWPHTTFLAISKSFLSAARRISLFSTAYGLILTTIVLLPFVAHQYIAYAAFCIEPTNTTDTSLYPRPWCASRLPLIYGFVQSHYWDVGFLRYWTVAQIPNFIIATPMLALVGCSTGWFLCSAARILGNLPRAEGLESKPAELRSLSPSMVLTLLPYALHALALSLMLFTSAHVQIALRVLPAATPWAAWAGAALIMKGIQVDQTRKDGTFNEASDQGEQLQTGGQDIRSAPVVEAGSGSRWATVSHLWIGWSVVWVFVSSILWLSFLPPA